MPQPLRHVHHIVERDASAVVQVDLRVRRPILPAVLGQLATPLRLAPLEHPRLHPEYGS